MGSLADAMRRKMGQPPLSPADKAQLDRMGSFEPSEYPTSGAPAVEGSTQQGTNEMLRLGLPVLGGAAGSAVGGITPIPGGSAIGGTLGAAAGGALAGKMTGEDPAQAAAVSALGEAGGRVLGHVAGPYVGQGMNWLVNKIGPYAPKVASALGRSMKSNMIEEGADAAQSLLRARGATLTAGQASRATWVDTFENIAENSILGRQRFATSHTSAQAVARSYIDDYVKSFQQIGDVAARGKSVQSAIENLAEQHTAMVGKLFEQADQALGGAAVDTRMLKLEAQRILDQAQLKKTLGQGSVGSILQDVLSKPDFVPFSDAHQLQSELQAVKRAMPASDDVMKGPANRWLTRLWSQIDDAIEIAGARTSGAAHDAYRDARALTRVGHETWNNDFINSIVGQESPEVLFEAAVKDGRPTNIRRLRDALLNPIAVAGKQNIGAAQGRDAWQAVQGTAIQSLVGRAKNPVTGQIDGDTLLRVLSDFGDEAGRELLPAGGIDRLKTLARTMYLAQKKAGGGGVGTVAIQLMQPGAALQLGSAAAGLLTGNPAVGGGLGTKLSTTIMLGPVGIAKAFTDPRFVDYYSRGLVAPIGTAQATRVIGQILGRLGELGLMDQAAVQDTQPPPATTLQDIQRRLMQDKTAQMEPSQ